MKVFSKTDDKFIYVAVWSTDLEGHWSGYVGYRNSTYKINVGRLYFHGGETRAIRLSELGSEQLPEGRSSVDLPNIELFGFSAIHYGDVNIGPRGEQGIIMHEEDNLWTKEVVFDHLINVVSGL